LLDYDACLAAARQVRERAAAPYSRFRVGAALAVRGGAIHAGCNVESATYGLTMCAERVALFSAIAAGARAFDAIVIVADTADPTPPCGACRQLLWEYCGDIEVLLADLSRIRDRLHLSALLPRPFDGRLLE
jgi:cytidine deaminase